jgi:hypothetical protein
MPVEMVTRHKQDGDGADADYGYKFRPVMQGKTRFISKPLSRYEGGFFCVFFGIELSSGR